MTRIGMIGLQVLADGNLLDQLDDPAGDQADHQRAEEAGAGLLAVAMGMCPAR